MPAIKAHWKLGVFTMIFLPILISLGIWQLNRAEQKQLWLNQLAQSQHKVPVSLAELSKEIADGMDLRFMQHRQVKIYGHFLSEPLFFLDNKIRDSRSGFEVLAPFKDIATNQQVWVDLGWIASVNRVIPSVVLPREMVELHTRVYLVPPQPLFLKKLPLSHVSKQIITYPDLTDLYAFIGSPPVYPFLLRMIHHQPGALNTAWPQPENLSPQRHQAYAFQWFALAVTLTVLYLIMLFRYTKA